MSVQPVIIVQPLTAREENLGLDPYDSPRRFHVAHPLHFNAVAVGLLSSSPVHGDVVPVHSVVVYPGPLWVPPRQPLRLGGVAVVFFFESGEGGRVAVLAAGLVALEDGGGGGGGGALEGLRGGGGEGAVGVVVEEEGE